MANCQEMNIDIHLTKMRYLIKSKSQASDINILTRFKMRLHGNRDEK